MPKIIHYRSKCIGCGICMEMQPVLWRMSKRDGKATLLKATLKKHVHQLEVADYLHEQCKEVAAACPVKIIKT
ncbi:MAG: hypothetical protein RLY16_1501 [Bacteroidota bacterium]